MVAACPFPAPRGTPIRALRMAEELASRGHRVHVVTYHHGVGRVDPSVHVHRIGKVRYRELSPGPSLRKFTQLDPMLARTLVRLLRRERIDLIHAHHFEGLLVGWAARALTRRGTPLIFDAHTLLTSELPTYDLGLPEWVKRLVAGRGDRWLPPLSDHVASCTERIRTKLIETGAVGEDHITLVPNGVELRRFDTGNDGRAPGAPPRLIFTGNLARYQGIELMLGALRLVLERRPEVRLTIVTGSAFTPYQACARELGVRAAIDLVPATVDEEPRLLGAADVALNPRVDCDGIPMKLLNYMAAARPVVSFAGSAPGLTHRDTAWLADDGDVPALAAGVLALLDDPALGRAMGEAARRFVQTNHTWAHSATLAERMYRGILAGRPTPVI
ncbi:MAG TPA: glycosyltransferase family 4 protein [Gemmatimonadales bacterium]|nr:glycosyltransferase family 4 protein [Gemmatimonadales bacterium]